MVKPKILIIDDEEDFLYLLKTKLEIDGYDVVTAINGQEGVEKAKTCKVNIIVCDLKMPKKDGLQVLKEVKANTNIKAPFIMLTGVDDFANTQKAYEDKADFYVTKPVEFADLLKNIRLLLDLAKRSTE